MRNDDYLELTLSDDPDVITDLWIHWKDDTALTVLKDVQSYPSRLGGVWHIPHMMTESVPVTANVEDAKVRYFSVVERRVDNTGNGVSVETSDVDCSMCGSGEDECGCFHRSNPFIDGGENETMRSQEGSAEVITAHLHDPLCPRLDIPADQSPAPDEYCARGLIGIVRRDERTKRENVAHPGDPMGNTDDHHRLCLCHSDADGCEDCDPDYCSCECVTIERLENLGAVPRNITQTEAENAEHLEAEFHASLDDFLQHLTVEWGVSRDWIDTVLTQGRSRLRQSALLAQIYAALNILYSGSLPNQWMTTPNTNPLFGGLSPLHYAMCQEDGLEDILTLLQGRLGRDVVDAWVGP